MYLFQKYMELSEENNKYTILLLEIFLRIDQVLIELNNSSELSKDTEKKVDEVHRQVEILIEYGCKNKNNLVLKELAHRLKWLLGETITIQASEFIRELQKTKLNIDYKTNDFELIRTMFPIKETPKIFSYNYFEKRAPINGSFNIYNTILKEIKFKQKSKDEYFSNYNTSYPFTFEQCDNTVNLMLKQGKIFLYENFFLWYNKVCEYYIKTLDSIIKNIQYINDNSWIYYIALMGISTVKCEYLFSHYENQFLLSGGEISWLLEGLKVVPDKLKKLADLNNLINNQPWNFDVKYIKIMLDNNWNKEELLEALLILIVFQRLSTLVISLRFNFFEDDFENCQLSEIMHLKKETETNILLDCLISMNQSDGESDEGIFLILESKIDQIPNLKELTLSELDTSSVNNSVNQCKNLNEDTSSQMTQTNFTFKNNITDSKRTSNTFEIIYNNKPLKNQFMHISDRSNIFI